MDIWGRGKEEGRRKKEEGRRKKEEGRRKKEEGRKPFDSAQGTLQEEGPSTPLRVQILLL
ncbi:hypothetical protein L2I57_008740 [Tychonema sp. BBK16]